jgi:hypothetical protein
LVLTTSGRRKGDYAERLWWSRWRRESGVGFNDEWEHAEKREYAYIREERILREQQWREREQRSVEGRYSSEKLSSIADFVYPEWDST